jgi:2-dehydropantoate 2-reductase
VTRRGRGVLILGQRVVEKWPVRYREALEPDHDFDLIVLSVPHHRLADGVLRGGLLPSVIFGTLGKPPTDRERAVRQAFREAGLRIKEQPDFRGWLWVHFMSDAGLFSQGLRLGSLSKLAGATGDLREALLAGRELLPLLPARPLMSRPCA